MTTKRCSRLRFMCVTAIILAAVIVSSSGIVDCFENQDAAAHPDGGHGGDWATPAPIPGTVHHMCPDPEPECEHPGAPPPPPELHRKIGGGNW